MIPYVLCFRSEGRGFLFLKIGRSRFHAGGYALQNVFMRYCTLFAEKLRFTKRKTYTHPFIPTDESENIFTVVLIKYTQSDERLTMVHRINWRLYL